MRANECNSNVRLFSLLTDTPVVLQPFALCFDGCARKKHTCTLQMPSMDFILVIDQIEERKDNTSLLNVSGSSARANAIIGRAIN